MGVTNEAKNAGYGFLNKKTEINEYDFFIVIPLEEGQTAIFNDAVHSLSGKTTIEVIIDNASNGQQTGYAKQHYHLKPGTENPMFNPEYCQIEIKVTTELNQMISALIRYKDADDTDLGADMDTDMVHNVAYVFLKVEEEEIGAPLNLTPKILIATKGYELTATEEIVESVDESIRKTAVLLVKDDNAPAAIFAPKEINQWSYTESPATEGHFTVVALKADNPEEGIAMMQNAINEIEDPAHVNKTRKGRVRKRRTATRGMAQNDPPKKEEKIGEEKKVTKVPIRKGKLRKKYTRTREIAPPVTKPEEQ